MLEITEKPIKKKNKKDKDFREIIKGSSLSFFINIAGMGFGYLFIMLMSRIYGDDSAAIYGKYVLVTILLRIASIFTRFGSDTSMLKITAAYASQNLWANLKLINKKFINIIFVLGGGVSLIVLVGAKWWAQFLKLPVNIIYLASLFVIPLALSLFYSQSLRGLKKVGISSFLRTSALPTLNFLLLPIFLFFVEKNSTFYKELPSYSFFVAIILALFTGFFYWRMATLKKTNEFQNFDVSHDKDYKQLLTGSYPLLLVESMIFIGTWIDQIMLGMFGSHEDVGIFNLCAKFAMIASLSLQAVNTISAPKFAEYYFKKDFKNLEKNFKSTTQIIFWTTIPIVLAFVSFPTFFLSFFGNSFNNGSLALVLLSIGALISVMTGSVGVLLQMTGHQKIIQNILLISVIIEITMNAILIPIYGVVGAAFASVVGTAIKNFSLSYFVKKHFGFNSIYPFSYLPKR